MSALQRSVIEVNPPSAEGTALPAILGSEVHLHGFAADSLYSPELGSERAVMQG